MAFILDYVREFPGAGYARAKAACQAAGFGVPAPVVYGNALRLVKNEGERGVAANAAPRAPSPVPPSPRGRRQSRAVESLAGLVEQFRSSVAERDRLRQAADEILAVLEGLRMKRPRGRAPEGMAP